MNAEFLKKLTKHTDLLAAGAVVLVVSMMVVPLPPFLLDLFITINISVALSVVVATMYLNKALEFSSFPALLLIQHDSIRTRSRHCPHSSPPASADPARKRRVFPAKCR